MKTLTLPAGLTPHDYQDDFWLDAHQQIDNGDGSPRQLLYASPTGTGKSIMELLLYAMIPDSVIVTPRLEIVAGMMQKGGHDTSAWSDNKLAAEALDHRITTPIRFRNMLAAGTFPFRPTTIIWDEAHHRSANSYQDIRAYLPDVHEIGLTATPFRGTPKGTEEFLAAWESLTWVLDYPTAADRGVIAVPTCGIWPLIDDDEIEVVNGEIVVRAAEEAVRGRIDEVVERCNVFGRWHAHGASAGIDAWDRPTLFAVPTTDSARELAYALNNAGLPAEAVTQDTPRAARNRIFAACERSELAIVQIDVVSEGVDLKLRRLIDLRPTMSPVKWLQQVGRITRPVRPCPCKRHNGGTSTRMGPCPACNDRGREPDPEYICCNRNLERHGYLYNGALPPEAIAAAQQAFGTPSNRAGGRAVGVENLGRFQAAELPLAGGLTGLMYNLTAVDGFTKTEYAVLLHPCSAEPLYAKRENTRTPAGNTAYGRWSACEKLPDLRGFQSATAKTLSEKQQSWYSRSAARYGLDPAGDVNRRNFAALPILTDLGITLGS